MQRYFKCYSLIKNRLFLWQLLEIYLEYLLI